jgi:transposase
MAAPVRYFDLVRQMSDAYEHRLRLVEYARQQGTKPAARAFATTVATVRKRLRRYQQQGPSGLLARSRAPHHRPRKTSAEIERQVVALRQQLPTFGARRLIREFDLALSHRALERTWRLHGLMKKRRRKYERKQDLAAVKATWRLFQEIGADIKDLCDLPHYWPQAKGFGLPWVPYTAREVRSGLLFLAYAERRSAAASAVFAARIQRHLDRYGAELRDLETFTSGGEFLAKAHTYQRSFNLARPNSHKENRTPRQIIERLAPRSALELCLLPPVSLDSDLKDSGGYDLPRLPQAKFPVAAGQEHGSTAAGVGTTCRPRVRGSHKNWRAGPNGVN